MARVVVVGAGAHGLCSALALLRAGHRVDVVARDLPRETSSALGPGLWRDPGPGADPRLRRWAEETRAVLEADAERSGSGVQVLPGSLDGVATTAPVVDLPAWLDALAAELLERGGSLTRLQLAALPTGTDVVVDCTGLGARHFGSDPTLSPVREQVLLLAEPARPAGAGRWWWAAGAGPGGAPAYAVPGAGGLLVGTARRPGEWERTASPQEADAVLERVRRALPELAGAEVRATRVGLWPQRRAVRLERTGDVVHCYGHGPHGLSTAWGCAAEVADLLA